jgi:energy-coupling factor transporter ATP-binding protein EcfA2
MQNWRPESNCKKPPKEITNKAQRAINSAYTNFSTDNTTGLQNTQSVNNSKTMKEVIMERSYKAGIALERIGRSKSLVHSIFYEGTLNVLYAKSGSGKTKVAVILTMMIAEAYPDKFIYYYAPDLSLDDILSIKERAQEKGLNNYFIDQDSVGKEFMNMMETYGKCEDVSNLVFVVDTLKKIASVNNKDGMSKTMGLLKQVTLRGATGIIVAHTNKDGHTISGTAEVEQDSDNVLTVATEYIGDDQMKVTIMASELRCRSRIEPLTLEISRDGFEYTFSEDHVNTVAIKAHEKEIERMGNIIEIAQDVVREYNEEGKPLSKTQLKNEILEADAYTGSRKNDTLSRLIDKMGENLDITLTRQGRTILCSPYNHSVMDLIHKADFMKKDNEDDTDTPE